MNKTIITLLISLCLTGLLAVSCSNDREGEPVPEGTVNVELDTRSIPNNTNCTLYIFRKVNTGSYTLLQEVNIPAPAGTKTITLNASDLVAANSFRFLYVSQPTTSGSALVAVENPSQAALTTGTSVWSDVRIRAEGQNLDGNIYYGIDDYTGTQLAAYNDSSNPIQTTLLRLAGQQVIDIYKVDDTEASPLESPLDVSSAAASVLDRVTSIGLTYTGLTKTIGFNDDKTISVKDTWAVYASPSRTLAYETTAGTDLLKVTLPQTTVGIEQASVNSATPGGSARIMGLWGLSATGTVSVQAVFTYRHTTPTSCTDSDPSTHIHAEGCYPVKTLTLNLPNSGGLNVVPNTYTVTKAGIRYDRVIDVGVTGGFGFATAWDNGDI